MKTHGGEGQVPEGGRGRRDAAVTQGTPRIAGNHQRLEDARKDSSLSLWREPGHADTLISDFWAPEPRENKFLLF